MRKNSKHLTMAATLTGLLALAPALAAQNQGTTSGSNTTGSSGSGSTGSSGSMSKSGSSSMSSSKKSSSDSKFAKTAAMGGMEEVQLGQLAAQKASNPDVKSFGQRMVDDHTKANSQLQQIASQKGMTLPTSLSSAQKQDMAKLSKLSGAAFDRTYVSMMVKDHKKDVAEFQKESKSGKDSDIKGFASTTLPTLQDHLKMVQDLSSTLNKSKSGSSKSASKSTSGH
jgi:putative membrane protein